LRTKEARKQKRMDGAACQRRISLMLSCIAFVKHSVQVLSTSAGGNWNIIGMNATAKCFMHPPSHYKYSNILKSK
jgi:hypothetical protein